MRPDHLAPPKCLRVEKCSVIDDKGKLISWYSDHPSEHGNLWDPNANDRTNVELNILRMVALPLRAASLYHQFKGAVMPHKLLNAIEQHLASLDTSLDNRDDWGLVQKWLIVAAQKDGRVGGITQSKSHLDLAFCTDTLLSNDDLIHW